MSVWIIFHKKALYIFLIIILTVGLLIFIDKPIVSTIYNPNEMEDIKREIERMYNIRSSSFVNGNLMPLKDIFDVSQKYGVWGLEHEVRRVKYLLDWSRQREIKFIDVDSTVRINKIYKRSGRIRISLDESYRFDYIYNNSPNNTVNSFGVGIRHTLDLIEKDEITCIYSDWYTDCFEDAMSGYSVEIHENTVNYEPILKDVLNVFDKTEKPYYDRQKAVAYADKYCGAAWGSGNNYKYNKKYRDYSGLGGDCTNFISQALSDKEGGGLLIDGIWRYAYSKYGNSSGSKAWVNADSFKNYLLYSGKGSIIKRGTYKELTDVYQGKSIGAVAKLKLGDLICYEKKGDIDHFAIVTGWDNNGYPVVNCHTTDRYHVPWDLGWGNQNIRFFLIHING